MSKLDVVAFGVAVFPFAILAHLFGSRTLLTRRGMAARVSLLCALGFGIAAPLIFGTLDADDAAAWRDAMSPALLLLGGLLALIFQKRGSDRAMVLNTYERWMAVRPHAIEALMGLERIRVTSARLGPDFVVDKSNTGLAQKHIEWQSQATASLIAALAECNAIGRFAVHIDPHDLFRRVQRQTDLLGGLMEDLKEGLDPARSKQLLWLINRRLEWVSRWFDHWLLI